jgi:hypothetical protein
MTVPSNARAGPFAIPDIDLLRAGAVDAFAYNPRRFSLAARSAARSFSVPP